MPIPPGIGTTPPLSSVGLPSTPRPGHSMRIGTGIDINPFHNPYLKGDLVLPRAGLGVCRPR